MRIKFFVSAVLTLLFIHNGYAVEWHKAGKFEVKGGLVRDNQTNLVWSRCLLGMEWKNDTCVGQMVYNNWNEALQSAETSEYESFTDWRLPTLAELETLRDKSFGNLDAGIPFIDWQVFPTQDCVANPKACMVWTSSLHSEFSEDSWIMDFNIGYSRTKVHEHRLAVRLVRDRIRQPVRD